VASKDIGSKYKVSEISNPVVIMFSKGKDIGRLPAEKNSKLVLTEKIVKSRFFPLVK